MDSGPFAVFLRLFGAALRQMFLHDGFLAGLELEDAAEGIDVVLGDGLEDDAPALFHKVDAGAGLDAEPAAEVRRNDQLAFGVDASGVLHCFVFLRKVCHDSKCKATIIL